MSNPTSKHDITEDTLDNPETNRDILGGNKGSFWIY